MRDKQTTLNPNVTALIVDLLMKAGVNSGDTIAVSFTGSFPGANIALLSACKATGIYPVIISSLGASRYGATDINFTWIDMEKTLENNSIFKPHLI